ncbi:MAG: hypothetical protein ABJL44_00855 [Algibacter sp.]
MDFSGTEEIKDLTGIEGFVNLKKLSAIQNEIAIVNLEFNKDLEILLLSGNLLSSIYLSFNTHLINVNIESNNLTTFTGIPNATGLKELNLSFNSLEAFSIDNTSLELLLISDNLLKTFNVNDAINLKSIFIKSNLIEAVDVTNNTLLETLVVSDNKIQSVNLEQNPKLTHICISSNLLTSLDVSSLQNLIWLTINNNPNLTCVKIKNGQNIPTVTKLENQKLNTICNYITYKVKTRPCRVKTTNLLIDLRFLNILIVSLL